MSSLSSVRLTFKVDIHDNGKGTITLTPDTGVNNDPESTLGAAIQSADSQTIQADFKAGSTFSLDVSVPLPGNGDGQAGLTPATESSVSPVDEQSRPVTAADDLASEVSTAVAQRPDLEGEVQGFINPDGSVFLAPLVFGTGDNDTQGFVNPDGSFFIAPRTFGSGKYPNDYPSKAPAATANAAIHAPLLLRPCGAALTKLDTGTAPDWVPSVYNTYGMSEQVTSARNMYDPAFDFDPADVHGVVNADGTLSLVAGARDETHGVIYADGTYGLVISSYTSC